MVSKHFLTTAALCAVLLFIGADGNVFGRGGGGGGGGHGGGGGGGHGGGGHGGGFGGGGRGFGGGYGRGFGYGGYGYGGFGYGGLGYGYGGGIYNDFGYGGGYPGYYTYPYAPPYYSYSDPGASYASPYASAPTTTPRTAYYYAPSSANYAAQAPVQESPATIHVVLPDPDATVVFDGHKTSSKGNDRYYSTPKLTPGGAYTYQLRVSWMQDGNLVTQERTVSAIPGQTTDAVFTRSAREGVPTISSVK